MELANLEESNKFRHLDLSAYAELESIAEEDEQEPPGTSIFETIIDLDIFYNKFV